VSEGDPSRLGGVAASFPGQTQGRHGTVRDRHLRIPKVCHRCCGSSNEIWWRVPDNANEQRHGVGEIDGDAGEQNRGSWRADRRCDCIFNLPQLPIYFTFSVPVLLEKTVPCQPLEAPAVVTRRGYVSGFIFEIAKYKIGNRVYARECNGHSILSPDTKLPLTGRKVGPCCGTGGKVLGAFHISARFCRNMCLPNANENSN
jgi:hypothetical protein